MNVEAVSASPEPSSSQIAAAHIAMPTAIKRGIAERCPVCGEGKLFRAYLKFSERCSHCGAPLGTIRADDGPAWATILLVGHLIVPFFILAIYDSIPEWVCFAILIPLTFGLTLFLLPRVKGLFAAVLWSLGMPTGVPQSATPATPAH